MLKYPDFRYRGNRLPIQSGTDIEESSTFDDAIFVGPNCEIPLRHEIAKFCRPGRPRDTWLRTLNANLHPLNHGLSSAWRLAQDRERTSVYLLSTII